MREPSSIRAAMRVIVSTTVIVTVISGFAAWLFDRKDFPTLGSAMWFAIQTVTTVGYGDVTPTHTVGRLIGAGIMLYAIAFLSILMAVITTNFVERSRRRPSEAQRENELLLTRLNEVDSRLERIERLLQLSTSKQSSIAKFNGESEAKSGAVDKE